MSTAKLTRSALIAALYAAVTLLALLFLGGLAWGPVQFRVSEALCVLGLFCPEAIPGLTIGCVLANLLNSIINGILVSGWMDVVFGSLATLLGSIWMWKLRRHRAVALLGPVLANALIVSAYLPLILAGLGYYTIPFTNIDLSGSYALMYLFGAVATGIGEAVVLYALGLPLAAAIGRLHLFSEDTTQRPSISQK
ncbi:MAG: QueT transporter family protein [Coriobacteriales bacterium]|jgi:uncharacterized membrane protein|nr:QueT transporter family protein [Coriobacteriales bacterium]